MLRKVSTCLAICLLFGSSGFAADLIRTRDESISGDITAMSPTVIQVKDRVGLSRDVKVSDIVSIRFDDEPDELGDARTQIRSGNLEEAMEMLRSIPVAQITRPEVKQEIQFYYAYCVAQLALGGAGTVEEAIGLMNKFIRAGRTSYHFYEASEIYGDLAAATGTDEGYQRAKSAYNVLAQSPSQEDKQRANLRLANVHQLKGEHPAAIKLYEGVISSGLRGATADRFRLLATLGKAASLAESKQGESGLQLVEGVIKSAEKGDTEVHALAYNAQGDCYRAMGNPKAAALAYLHVDALYYQHPPLHAEALARIAILWEQMDKPDRMASARKTLKSKYPNSKWARN